MICYYSQNTSDATCVGFSHPVILQFSTDTCSGCPTVEFSSDTIYLELVQPTPQIKGLSPSRPPQLQKPVTTGGHSYTPDLLTVIQRFPQPLLRFDNLLEWLTELWETLYLLPVDCERCI